MKKYFVLALFGLALIIFSNRSNILSSDQSAAVSVPAHPSDYQVSVESVTSGPSFSQNQTITYKITYGSLLSYNGDITLEAAWSQGTIEGDTTPSIDILDYVIGSASNGYNQISPIIDLGNRTIKWTIPSFPASTTGQTVTFALKTNSNYTGDRRVNFTITGTITDTGGISAQDSSNVNYYLYSPSGSSSNPVLTTASQTPTPTPSITFFTIDSVNIRSISQSKAEISVATSQKASITLRYGTSSTNLDKSLTSPEFLKQTMMALDSLNPSSYYFFRVYAKNSSGKLAISDIFIFKTASISTVPVVLAQSLIVASGNTIISKPSGEKDQNLIVLPVDTNFEFKFRLDGNVGIKKAVAMLRNENVLRFSTVSQADAGTIETKLIEIEPGIFSGRLKTPSVPGKYGIYLSISDLNGNISESKIANLHAVRKFRIFSKKTGLPIEGARVLIYFYNGGGRMFEVLPQTAITVLNPSFSDSKGNVSIVLPQAKYKVLISEIGYKDKNVEFTIGPLDRDGYPQVYLEKQQIGIFEIIRFFSRTLNDIFLRNTGLYVDSLTGSTRFFDLAAELTLALLITLTLFAFTLKTHIPILRIPSYFLYSIHRLAKTKQFEKYVSGVVLDQKNNPIPRAHVYLVNGDSEEIVGKGRTDKSGNFYFNIEVADPKLIVMKKGFKKLNIVGFNPALRPFKIFLSKSENYIEELRDLLKHFIFGLIGLSFEVLVIASLIFELLFLNSFGFKALPYLLLSLFNFAVWIIFLQIKKHNTIS